MKPITLLLLLLVAFGVKAQDSIHIVRLNGMVVSRHAVADTVSVNLALIDSLPFSIEAKPPANVGRVDFSVFQNGFWSRWRSETVRPFSMFGDVKDVFQPYPWQRDDGHSFRLRLQYWPTAQSGGAAAKTLETVVRFYLPKPEPPKPEPEKPDSVRYQIWKVYIIEEGKEPKPKQP